MKKQLLTFFALYLFTPLASLAMPLWSLIPLTATSVAVPNNGTETIQYRLTNNSRKSHRLAIIPVQGITQDISGSTNCRIPAHLDYQQSCILSLIAHGSQLSTGTQGGPKVCQSDSSGNPNINQCYQPAASAQLNLTAGAPTYSIGGQSFGLLGTLVLLNNGTDPLTLTVDNAFAFSKKQLTGTPYAVSIQSQPAGQTCTVTQGQGVVSGSNVTSVSVFCANNAYNVGGTVAGLVGSVELQNHGSNDTVISANGAYNLSHPVANRAPYIVSIKTQPPTQTCSLSNARGIVNGANVNNVNVTCATNAYSVGGTVSGLSGTVTLQNNGNDNLIVNANGNYTFPTNVAEGAPYDVTIATQPTTQTCTVSNGNGIMGAGNVTNVNINCIDHTTILSTSITNLNMSVNNPGKNAALTGIPRIVTIANVGSAPANNLTLVFSSLPTGTTTGTTCGASLNAGTSCQVTFTPGATSTGSCSSGVAPIPGILTISSTNAATRTINYSVLDYGCIYQSGYIYSINDSTPNTTSIQGATAFLSNESNIELWACNSPGCPNTSFSGASSFTDGSSNTALLNTATNQYPAAQVCIDKVANGITGWYLPALCELGYYSSGSNCGDQATPLIQNMKSNLADNNLGNFSDIYPDNYYYWSSTENSNPTFAWTQRYDQDEQVIFSKSVNLMNIRCARQFTG